MEQTQCSEMSTHKIQMPGNHPKERIQHSQHDESFKSKILISFLLNLKATTDHHTYKCVCYYK